MSMAAKYTEKYTVELFLEDGGRLTLTGWFKPGTDPALAEEVLKKTVENFTGKKVVRARLVRGWPQTRRRTLW